MGGRKERRTRDDWTPIAKQLGFEHHSPEDWQNPYSIKMPGFMRGIIERFRQETGAKSAAQAVGQSLAFIKLGTQLANQGYDLVFEGTEGEEIKLSNEDLRKILSMPPQTSVVDILPGIPQNPNHKG